MRTLVLGALVAATLASGCRAGGAPPTLEAQLAADARFVLSRGDGNEPLPSVAAVEAALPFVLVLPRHVPLDAEITGVWVTTPPAGLDGRDGTGQRRNTRVQLAYSNEHTRPRGPRVRLVLEEQIASVGLGDVRYEEIRIADGVRAEVARSRAGQPPFVALAWPVCGIGLVLTVQLTGGMSEREAIRVAESTLDACAEGEAGAGG